MANEQGIDVSYRLPATVRPIRYELLVRPDLDGPGFTGHARIEIDLLEATTELTCNAAELEVSGGALHAAAAGAGGERSLEVSVDEALERVTFRSAEEIEPGSYVLDCDFAGPWNERLCGFYLSRFKDTKGVERVLASTHFESTDARKAFPCWDEPALKAVFAVTLEIADDLFVVSNAPEKASTSLGDGRRRVEFEDTMKMSTYLVAYAVGPFEVTETVVADGVPLRVVVPVGKLHLTEFALEAAAHSLAWYHEYFDIAYPSQKLDLVAIPDFAMGAMENLGCVTFREQDLLCDPAHSSIPELGRIAEVVDHEIAHMWFGDLVTMKWWNGIWLNEAFATFMSICCLDDFRPEWSRWVEFGTEKDLALQVDGLHSTRAIEFPVEAPDEAEAMFDNLTYLKGGNVLRMVEQYLGTERFRAGVRRYLRQHAYGNTETTDLWDAIEAESGGEPVRALLDSWIFQAGHPLVTARLEQGEVMLTEQPFEYLPEAGRPPGGDESAIARDWLVPIKVEERAGTGSGSGSPPAVSDRASSAGLLGPAPHGVTPLRVGVGDGLPVANAGGSGTYRLRYEGPLFEQIVSNLGRLEPLERFNLVADTWACTLAGLSGLEDFLALVKRLSGEDDPNVWGVIQSAVGLLDRTSAGSVDAELAAFVRGLARPELDRIGWEPHESESSEQERTRSILFGVLGTIGADEDVRRRAVAWFEAHRAGTSPLPASLAQVILSVVVYCGGDAEFEAVRDGFRNPSDPLDEQRHLYALTATRDERLVVELLEMTRGEIRTQDAHHIVRPLLASRAAGMTAWAFAKEHWEEYERRLPSTAMPTMIGGVARLVPLDRDGKVGVMEDVWSFVAAHPFGGHQRSVDQALERQATNARFVVTNHPLLGELLAKA